MRYNTNFIAREEFMVTYLDKNNDFKISISSSLEDAIDKAIMLIKE